MALISGSNGVPATNKKAVVAPKIQYEPVKEVVQDTAPKAQVVEEQPRVTKVVNSKKKKN
jgi:hypothetical protein|tara:strand:- start:1526 stop:1705 length:180 start_codon:yes stop_codon:yes gene_type:complete